MNWFFGVILVLMGMAVFGIVPILLGAIAHKHAVGDAMKGTRQIALAAIFLGVFWFFAIPILAIPISNSRSTMGEVSVVPTLLSSRTIQAPASSVNFQELAKQHTRNLNAARGSLSSGNVSDAKEFLMSARGLRAGNSEIPEDLRKSMLDEERGVDEALRRVQEAQLPAPVEASAHPVVTAVQPGVGLVMLSVGSQQGVKPGDQFTISRGGEYISRVQVEKVYPDMCSTRVVKAHGEVKVGDEARPHTPASSVPDIVTPSVPAPKVKTGNVGETDPFNDDNKQPTPAAPKEKNNSLGETNPF
ncbi:MAG TPA: hypothetical protein VEJ63_01450 [Planctomycetota bacterium]|nr:hypothetical protein [Planctomycetota bacterium]